MYWVMSTITTIGFGDFTGNASNEILFQMMCLIIGVGFFGYILAQIDSMLVQVYTLEELQKEREDMVSVWQMRIDRVFKEKFLSNHYYDHINGFFLLYWNLDYNHLKDTEFYQQLKPRLQNELADSCFKYVYKRFDGFFNNLEKRFCREIVHNLVFEEFKIFPPYTETYKDDKRSFPDRQNNCIIEKGQIPTKIYFFVAGEAYASNQTGRYQYFRLPDGSYIGEAHMLAGIPISYCICYDEEIG